MLVVLHSPGHNGDQLLSQPFVKIFVESNPAINFKLMFACSQLLYKDIVNNNTNCTFFEGGHPAPWMIDKNINNTQHELFNIYAVPYHYDIEKQIIYINMWRTLTLDNNINCTYNGGRLDYIRNMINDIENISGYRLEYNCNTNTHILPILPVLNDEKTTGIMEKVGKFIHSFKNKKVILFYNLMYRSGPEHEYSGDFHNNLISEVKKDKNSVLLLVRCDENHPTVVSLEKHFNLSPSEDGYNLIISAKIAKLCNAVYMKQSGGSLFVVNDENINNNVNNTDYHFFGPGIAKKTLLMYNLNIIN